MAVDRLTEKLRVVVVNNKPEALIRMTSIDLLQFAGRILGFEVDVFPVFETVHQARIWVRGLIRTMQRAMVPMWKSKDRSSEPAPNPDWARRAVTSLVSP